MDVHLAGRTARSLELLHSLAYFAPEVEQELAGSGLESGRMTYFAGRSAPMGAVSSGVVTAVFYNFNPALIADVLPRAWKLAEPEAIVQARYRGVDAAYRALLGDKVIASAAMSEAAQLAAIAAQAVPGVDGRPLYAGYAALEWPEQPHLVLWHALTLLREYRGDGHVAALQTAGLSGLEALITHTAAGIGFRKSFAQSRRGWSGDEWAAAVAGLVDRELLTPAAELTADGRELREVVEDLTDELAAAPWTGLGEDGAARLAELATPWCRSVRESGLFPEALFGPRYGESR
ncbi:SCO6745 family protein [Rhodococcus sp. (in: high G+C Gram-positive bacteria)]|uniref:SCO6745 family protein n=1 Tax=Rhodococcus sp. TaxID=1831 RepID=UPI003B8A67DC